MPGSRRTRPTRGCRQRRATGSSRCVGESGSAMASASKQRIVLVAALGAAFAAPIAAQNAEPPRAPRILDAPASQPAAPAPAPAPTPAVEPRDLRVTLPSIGTPQRPPNAARLAPLPSERND